MRVFGTSDIHLDINPLSGGRYRAKNQVADIEAHPEDVLLLAGDNAEIRSFFPKLFKFGEDASDRLLEKTQVKKDFERICAAYKYVVTLAGNHEFYSGNIDTGVADWREVTADIPNLIILDNETVVLDDKVRIIGTVLWTDMKGGDPQVAQTIKYALNDYNYIRTHRMILGVLDEGRGVRIDPGVTMDAHRTARQFIVDELAKIGPDDHKVTVVMTHHAPVMAHANPQRTGDNVVDYAYACTDMDDIIMDNDAKVAVWFHGHTHDTKLTEIGQTLVATKARGYDDIEFEPLLLLDLDVG